MPLDVLKKPDNNNVYASWGDYAGEARRQGFYPETSYQNKTVFRSPYGIAFNNVDLTPIGQGTGHIAFIGDNNAHTFDVVIRNKNGDIVKTIYQNVSPQVVQDYITNQNSTVAQRNMSILKGTNIDKPNDKGQYVAIK